MEVHFWYLLLPPPVLIPMLTMLLRLQFLLHLLLLSMKCACHELGSSECRPLPLPINGPSHPTVFPRISTAFFSIILKTFLQRVFNSFSQVIEHDACIDAINTMNRSDYIAWLQQNY